MNKVVYSVESYAPKDKTVQEVYGRLERQADECRMRMQVLEDLYDESHDRLVKVIDKMEKIAEEHPEVKDWD